MPGPAGVLRPPEASAGLATPPGIPNYYGNRRTRGALKTGSKEIRRQVCVRWRRRPTTTGYHALRWASQHAFPGTSSRTAAPSVRRVERRRPTGDTPARPHQVVLPWDEPRSGTVLRAGITAVRDSNSRPCRSAHQARSFLRPDLSMTRMSPGMHSARWRRRRPITC